MIDILSPDLEKHCRTARQREVLSEVLKHGSNTDAAAALGINRRTVDRHISAVKNAAIEAGEIIKQKDAPDVLFLDIETAPMLTFLYSLWREPGSHKALQSDWYITSWAARWMGQKRIYCKTLYDDPNYTPGSEDDKYIVEELWKLINKADYIITHNGDNFDIKRINTRFMLNGIGPPTTYKSIDTLKIAKRMFDFSSNSLAFIADKLGVKAKTYSGGWANWRQCLLGRRDAWRKLAKYNKNDVEVLEEVYYKLRAWDNQHPNFAVHSNVDAPVCNVCGSTDVDPTEQPVPTQVQVYVGFTCNNCGHQMRGRTNVRTYQQKQATLMNAK
jgi:uncharacterized protein YprB with RNaseH-like and TPR domain